MGYNKYGWSKQSTPTPDVPLQAPIDPEHLNPTSNPEYEGSNAVWSMGGQGAPTLPDTLYGDLGGGPIGGGGPIDHTPDDPQFGVGGGHGQTQMEAQAVRGALMDADYGAVAAHQYQALTDRYDGDGPHVLVLNDTQGDGDSPATLEHKRTGVGTAGDPYARVGQRIQRWWNRTIDMHWYAPEYRPMTVRNAYTAQAQPVVPDGNQYTSPYPTAATYNPQSADSFVSPQVRRTPTQWDAPLSGDGITDNPYQLASWGL